MTLQTVQLLFWSLQVVSSGDNFKDEIITTWSRNILCKDFFTSQSNDADDKIKSFVLQSPSYPENYPENLECINVIKAPSSNMIIKINFVETFYIEPSKDCSHDVLLINDGPFGFSKPLSVLCGKQDMIETIYSSGPYVWLRFYSDQTLTASGFKLVYQFIRGYNQPTITYFKKITIEEGKSEIITNEMLTGNIRQTENYQNFKEGVYEIRVSDRSNVFLSDIDANISKSVGYDQFIEFYDGVTFKETGFLHKKYHIIHKTSKFDQRFFKSERVVIRIRFLSLELMLGFRFVVTVLMKSSKHKNCADSYFSCRKPFCISKMLECDKWKNCPDGDDEMICEDVLKPVEESANKTEKELKRKMEDSFNFQLHASILGSIASFLLLVFIIFIIHSKRQSSKNSKSKEPPTTFLQNKGQKNVKPYLNIGSASKTIADSQIYRFQSVHTNIQSLDSIPVYIQNSDFSRSNKTLHCTIGSRSDISQFKDAQSRDNLQGCKSLPSFERRLNSHSDWFL